MSTAATLAPLRGSLTHDHLYAAHHRSLQARRTYLACARRMEEASLHVIAHALDFTAAQEKEHADVFRGLLAAHGEAAPDILDAPLPPLPDDPEELLRALSRRESETAQTHCPESARIAQAEGFPRIGKAFARIAETEMQHARRFQQYAEALRTGTLFRDDARVSWICLPCGELHAGQEPPAHCAACGCAQGGFIRSQYHPFGVGG